MSAMLSMSIHNISNCANVAEHNTNSHTDCWASSANATGGSAGCAQLEKALRECMDKPRPKSGHKSNINYHLSRLYPQIKGPERRGGSLG